MNSLFTNVVIVAAIAVLVIVFPVVVYSTTCLSEWCTDADINAPCTTKGRGTNKEKCVSYCFGTSGCACTRPDTTVGCRCMIPAATR